MDKKRYIDDVPPFQRPLIAGENDPIIGYKDDGSQIYRSQSGKEYFVGPHEAPERRTLKEGFGAMKEDFSSLVEELGDDPFGVATNLIKGLYEGAQDFSERFRSGGATLGDAYAGAGGAGIASTPARVPEGATRIFGGRRAVNAPTSELDRAEELLASGKSQYDVWKETGWITPRGEGQLPRFEIDDSKSELDVLRLYSAPELDADVNYDGFSDGADPIYVSDVLDHPTVFNQYPQLHEIEVRLDNSPKSYGSWDPNRRVISINPTVIQKNGEDIKGVLLHEIQHVVQEIEGFSRGSNTNTASNALEMKKRTLQRYYLAVEDKIEELKSEIKASLAEGKRPREGIFEDVQRLKKESSELSTQFDNAENLSGNTVYHFQRGEIEARDAATRRHWTEDDRKQVVPNIASQQQPISDDVPRWPQGTRDWNPVPRKANKYAKGGLVETMDEQQMLAALGGLKDDGATVDPVSGNEVPPGSMDQEVSDQVDAKLSEGEYVLPADVVRFFGVDKIEKMVKKAKEGLQEMEANGRIGGEDPETTEGEELPFSDDELEVEDDAMAMQMAAGGLVPTGANPYEEMQRRLQGNGTGTPFYPPEQSQDSEFSSGVSPGQDRTGFGRPMDQWEADDYASFANGRETFDRITKYAGALGGLPGVIATAAVRGVAKNMEKKARERLEQTLENPDLDPAQREQYQTAYDTLSQRQEENNSLTSGKPRDTLAARAGLYGEDRVPFNEGAWNWRADKKEKDQKKEEKTQEVVKEVAKKTSKPTTTETNSSSSSRGSQPNTSGGWEGASAYRGTNRSRNKDNDKDDDKSKMAKGGLVKRRKK